MKPVLNSKTIHQVRLPDLTWQVLMLIQGKPAYVYLTPDYRVQGAINLDELNKFKDKTPGGVVFKMSCKALS